MISGCANFAVSKKSEHLTWGNKRAADDKSFLQNKLYNLHYDGDSVVHVVNDDSKGSPKVQTGGTKYIIQSRKRSQNRH